MASSEIAKKIIIHPKRFARFNKGLRHYGRNEKVREVQLSNRNHQEKISELTELFVLRKMLKKTRKDMKRNHKKALEECDEKLIW
ncbi:Protein EFR3 [Dirofilaria immitis]